VVANRPLGMFTVDQQTRMTWFQPCPLEPESKYEMVGVLFSLAVYNGITLPVTFPLALYRWLLGKPPSSEVNDIRDGWPALAKSFDQLLAWSDGDVAEVFMRSYTFSFEAYGRNVDVNMLTADDITTETGLYHGSPSNDSGEAPFVTNENRPQFVLDYVSWLTHKSVAPQLAAFSRGFHACIHPHSLSLFDPESLQALVEGTQDIDVSALKSATRYEEGYSASHATIKDFWSIVEQYDLDTKRKLLEFVTASERVPITGFESMNFHIVRSGDDTEMLPTSSTCFGKLMLPQYVSRDKMRGKLELAIQNCRGFGVV
jgi:hypothetical protein